MSYTTVQLSLFRCLGQEEDLHGLEQSERECEDIMICLHLEVPVMRSGTTKSSGISWRNDGIWEIYDTRDDIWGLTLSRYTPM